MRWRTADAMVMITVAVRLCSVAVVCGGSGGGGPAAARGLHAAACY